MSSSKAIKTINVVIADGFGSPYWEAKFRHDGRQAKRRVGAAWLVPNGSPAAKPNGKSYKNGQWVQRRGHPADGALSYDDAVATATTLVEAFLRDQRAAVEAATMEEIELARPRTFRELAREWRAYLDRKGTKPSTLVGYDAMLAEPGTAFKRGEGTKVGYIMASLGDTPASEITAGDVETLLATISATGAAGRTVEKHRIMVRSILNYGIRETKRSRAGKGATDGYDYGLSVNAAQVAEGPRQRSAGALVYYLPEEVEAIARALEQGWHRHAQAQHQPECERSATRACNCHPAYKVGRQRFDYYESAQLYLSERRDDVQLRSDSQDAAAVRLSAYTGLRLGELLALRWADVDWAGAALTVSRAMSAGEETATKSGKVRRVPLPDQAVAALNDLSKRGDFADPGELVICNVATGRVLDGSALRRRYKDAQVAAGVHQMRWHDLRHTYGSLLAASGEELVTIKAMMGHSNITTTEVYLHARPSTELAARFTAAFASTKAAEVTPV
jgi:integrase